MPRKGTSKLLKKQQAAAKKAPAVKRGVRRPPADDGFEPDPRVLAALNADQDAEGNETAQQEPEQRRGPPPRVDPLQRHRNLAAMVGDELRTYARQLGVTERDVVGLSEDRLRQNCQLKLVEIIESL